MSYATTHSDADIRQLAEEVLRWYADAGVDLALDETAPDRFAELAREKDLHREQAAKKALDTASTGSATGVRPSSSGLILPVQSFARSGPAATMAPEEAISAACELARNASSLEELRDAMENFEGCALRSTATRLVFSDGDPGAKLMLVGEAPGREEDIEGRPFVGAAGQLLEKMLAAIGLSRNQVYIANVVPWRPPGNRTPTMQEIAICKPFLQRQIELAAPEIILCLGGPASQTLSGQKQGIVSIRGRWLDYTTAKGLIKLMPSFHPAYLLRQPAQKRLAWRDLLAVSEALNEIASN